jgi:uncharacterized glyoxalase superfamily protein PhnB
LPLKVKRTQAPDSFSLVLISTDARGNDQLRARGAELTTPLTTEFWGTDFAVAGPDGVPVYSVPQSGRAG